MRIIHSFLKRLSGVPPLPREEARRALMAVVRDSAAFVGPAPAVSPADLDSPVFYLCDASGTRTDAITYRDLYSHLLIFGDTGSGKTSGPGKTIFLAMLRAGFGGLVLVPKAAETENIMQMLREGGREGDAVLVGHNGSTEFRYNAISEESKRPDQGAGFGENLLHLIVQLTSVNDNRVVGGQAQDPLWGNLRDRLVRNMIDLQLLAGESVTFRSNERVLLSAPRKVAQLEDIDWVQESYCMQLLEKAEARSLGTVHQSDFERVREYFRDEAPNTPEKMRSSYEKMYSAMVDVMERGFLRRLCSEDSTITPEAAYSGKIIIIALPEKEYGQIGRLAAVYWKYMCQRTWERRIDTQRPLFIYADECQLFATDYDQKFMQTARSKRIATIYLTQNKPNLDSILGGEVNGGSIVKSLLGNMKTKIFCCNGEEETNRFAAETIGQSLQRLRNQNTSRSYSFSPESPFGFSDSHSEGWSEQYQFEVMPRVFGTLPCGGNRNRLLVGTVVYQAGRVWSTGKNWRYAYFRQSGAETVQELAPSGPTRLTAAQIAQISKQAN